MSSSWESRVSGSRGKYLPATTGSSGSISVDYDRQLLADCGLRLTQNHERFCNTYLACNTQHT